ncbi:hypothetical protein D5086_018538 [Populus alba]|uniref:Uncharacterized protein n=1 Tax=Populus alba TaxID=43335 RepID=A0ACC4BPZ9_POPAL
MDAVKFACDSHTWLGTRDSWNIYALVASHYLHTRPDDRVAEFYSLVHEHPSKKILRIFHESPINVIFSFLVYLQEMEGIVSRAAGMHSQDFNWYPIACEGSCRCRSSLKKSQLGYKYMADALI